MRCITKPVATGTVTRTTLVALSLAMWAILAGCTNPTPGDQSTLPPPSTQQAETTPPPTSTTRPPLSTSTTVTTEITTSTTSPVRDPVLALQVPPSSPPVIDGVVGEDEWTDAVTESMSDGAMARWLYTEETLYVVVDGTEIGAVNVVIATDDQVLILHSSAALGSALYAPGRGSWELVHGFSWCCRTAADESAPAQLLADEGWKANIGFAGSAGVVEYAIALPWQGAAVAISSIRDEDDKGFWPADLSAEAQDQLLGVPPSERDFKIEEWARVTPAD